MEKLDIYTDGSCLKNPGGVGGYGAVLLTDPPTVISGHIPAPTTNNRAELMAVIFAIFHAQSLGFKYLRILTDSRYIVDTMNLNYAKNANKDLWDLLDLSLSTLNSCKFRWVRGHNGNEYNELADKLASEGANKYPDIIKEQKDEFTVTEIGGKLNPKMNPVSLNKFLIKHGYQVKNYKDYSPTFKGIPFSVETIYIDSDGFQYRTYKWNSKLVTEIQAILDNL